MAPSPLCPSRRLIFAREAKLGAVTSLLLSLVTFGRVLLAEGGEPKAALAIALCIFCMVNLSVARWATRLENYAHV